MSKYCRNKYYYGNQQHGGGKEEDQQISWRKSIDSEIRERKLNEDTREPWYNNSWKLKTSKKNIKFSRSPFFYSQWKFFIIIINHKIMKQNTILIYLMYFLLLFTFIQYVLSEIPKLRKVILSR